MSLRKVVFFLLFLTLVGVGACDDEGSEPLDLGDDLANEEVQEVIEDQSQGDTHLDVDVEEDEGGADGLVDEDSDSTEPEEVSDPDAACPQGARRCTSDALGYEQCLEGQWVLTQCETGTKCESEQVLCEPIEEHFDEEDMPDFEYVEADNYYLSKPWNYEKDYNGDRLYPLVVYLHGMGGAGEPAGLTHLGYGESERAVDFKKTHPSFVYAAQTDGMWDYARVIQQVEDLKSTYRIDLSRIYLVGYSMGGSGSYALANAYYDHNQHRFAAIIRLAGQSQTSLRDPLSEATAVWLHIGLQDTATRVQVTREAYENLKTFHAEAVESEAAVTIEGHPGTTLTLTLEGEEIVKKSEYDNDGHGVSNFPFNDPNLILWLYSHKLD